MSSEVKSVMFDGLTKPAKKQLFLFFVVDASGSMAGEKIGAVNNAIQEALQSDELRNAGGTVADIQCAVLQFSNGAKWLTPLPLPLDQIIWKDINADGGTDLGEACRELARQLRSAKFLNAPAGLVPPVILLMSDGNPTDNFDKGVEELWKNQNYKDCVRLAAAYGDDVDLKVLERFTGGSEAVFKLKEPADIKKWIKLASFTASKTSIHAKSASDKEPETAQEAVVSAMKNTSEWRTDPKEYEE